MESLLVYYTTSSDSVSWSSCSRERGFSVNKEVLAPNLKAVSLTALRLIHDTISEGQIEIGDYIITNELLTSCSHASNRYRMYLMERQKEDQEPEKKIRKRESSSRRIDCSKEKKNRAASNSTEVG